MHAPPILLDLVLILAAAAAVTLASHAARLPAVVGLLLTGVLLGPSGLGLVRATDDIELFAELGVVALLFTLGLEFSRDRVRQVRRPFFVAGPLQLGGTVLAVGALAMALGQPPGKAFFAGFLVALSSTAVVLRLWVGRREMESPHGRAGLGVLLFQDLALAPMLAVVPVLAGAVGEGAVGQFLVRFLGSAAVLAAVFLVARFVVPGLLGRLVATRMREIFILGAVAICLGMALFTVELGFSAALGAFLAGVILAESDFSHQLEADVAPFRDVFTSFFFVSIGMLLDLRAAIERWDAVLAFTAAALLVKALVAVGAFRVAGLALRPAVTAGVGLAQIGEFSFVLAMAGRAAGVLSPERYQVVVAAAVLTLLATPLLIAGGPGLGRWASRRWGELPASQPEVEALADHVVLVGFGLNGRNLALVLDEARIPWIGLDLDRHRVRAAREAGAPLHFGDATRREILELARIGTARALVVAISDPDALRRVVRLARQLGPRLWILVRSRELAELDTLVREGANEVVAEELESSIEIAVRVLQRYHVPRNVIDAEVRALRAGSYEMLRGASPVGVVTASLLAALERGTTDVFRVEQDSAAAGRTLAELDLRRATGASVLAVVRGGTGRANPNPDLVLAAGDELVLVGGHAEIEAAWQRLRGESP